MLRRVFSRRGSSASFILRHQHLCQSYYGTSRAALCKAFVVEDPLPLPSAVNQEARLKLPSSSARRTKQNPNPTSDVKLSDSHIHSPKSKVNSSFLESTARAHTGNGIGHADIHCVRQPNSVSEHSLRSCDVKKEHQYETFMASQVELLSSASTKPNDSSEYRCTQSPSFGECLEEDNALPGWHIKIKLLQSEQFSTMDVARLLKSKAFTSCALEHLAAVLQVLKECFGEMAHQVLVKNSVVLGYPLELLQKKLKVLVDLKLDKLAHSESLLSMRSELLQKKLAFCEELNMTVEERNRMIGRNRNIIRLSIENSIKPSIKFLESIGISKEEVKKTCCRILPVAQLIRLYEYFHSLGCSSKDFSRALQFRYGTYKTLQFKAQSLKDLGFSRDDVRGIIRKQPGVLAFSCEKIRMTVEFLVHDQGHNMADIVKFPTCFSYSLEGRIIPRFRYLERLGLSKAYTLSTILCCSDMRFKERCRKMSMRA